MVGRTYGVMWVYIIFDYTLWMLMIYLTDVWKLSLTHAAGIISVYVGVELILPLILQYVVDTVMGHYWVLLVSTIAYSVGMGLLAMSTPPALAKSLGTCSAYEPDCIGKTQEILFYVALAILALGSAGHTTSLAQTCFAQFVTIMDEFAETLGDGSFGGFLRRLLTMFANNVATFLVPIVAILGFPYIKPWSLRFGIPAILSLVATLVYLSNTCSYNFVKPSGSLLTQLFRVPVAAISKLFKQLPGDDNQLYDMQTFYLLNIPRTRGLRCLDKAAIVLPDEPLEEQQTKRWRLCTVTEVEVTKMIIYAIPMCMSFILLGLLSVLPYTYFLEQAKNMNHHLGNWKLPLAVFLAFYYIAQQQFPKMYFYFGGIIFGANSKIRWYSPNVGIVVSMILGILCCVTAAKVESTRLDVVRRNGLIDKPDERVPLSMFRLLPQYLLVGAAEGMFQNSLIIWLTRYFDLALSTHLLYLSSSISGLGCLGSILSVYVAGKISESGGKPSWFQETLNQSRLDKYYWTLSWLIAANIGWFFLLKIFCRRRTENEEPECCCCC